MPPSSSPVRGHRQFRAVRDHRDRLTGLSLQAMHRHDDGLPVQ